MKTESSQIGNNNSVLTWTASLLARMDAVLSETQRSRADRALAAAFGKRGTHLAVFVEPFLSFLLEGRKTVESRFSVNRCAPYRSVNAGDLVIIKMSGGPIVAIAEVSKVWFYELDEKGLAVIRTRFGRQLCIDDPE